MAKLINGIFGNISGSIGPLVFTSVNGTTYIRRKSTRRNYKPTEIQLVQRAKFSLVVNFVKTMHSLLMLSFKTEKGKTGSNSALSYTIKKAITGIYPNMKLDYSLVKVSKGRLSNAINPTAFANEKGEINFQWQNNAGGEQANSNDKSILVAYCEELNECSYKIEGVDRSARADSLIVPAFSGKKVQTWIAFGSNKNKSDSIYTGSVDVK